MRATVRLLPALLLLTVVGCSDVTVGQSPEPGAANGTWTRLVDSPLSPRNGAVAAYVDGKAVFVGGDTGRPCPPSADCAGPVEYAADGASYDVVSGAWTPIADAPLGIPDQATHAVLGRHLFIRVKGVLLDYDAVKDRWSEHAVPGTAPDWLTLTADGRRLVLTSGSDEEIRQPDRVLDTRTGTWTTLPDDPFENSFDRGITATAAGLVLTAREMDSSGNPADPGLVRAALLPRGASTWTRFRDSDQLGGGRWTWTGHRMVDPTLGGADGGETNNYGKTIPFGGVLDPATGTWSRLPKAPAEGSRGWPVDASDGAVIAAGGWLYDDAVGGWTALSRPKDAPPTPGVAVWARDTLLVLGGTDWDAADEPDEYTAKRIYSTGLWAYRPGANQ